MHRNPLKRLISFGLTLALSISCLPTTAWAAGNDLTSPLLITEIVPNTKSTDQYEYYELTNVTDQEIDLSAFDIMYYYTTGTSYREPVAETLPANTSMLVWIRNDDNADCTEQDFREYYNISDDVLISTVSCAGFANSAERSLYIKTMTGEVINYVTYETRSYAEDEAAIFSYEGDEVTASYGTCTPGVSSSIDGTYAVADSATITVTEVNEMDATDSLTIAVTACDLPMVAKATLTADGMNYNMTYSGDVLSATVSGGIFTADSVNYSVTVTDGITSATSATHTTAVSQPQNVDTSLAPVLTVSELIPDTTNINSADGYEFIEIYNNAGYTIDLKDYVLYYYYHSSDSVIAWWNPTDSHPLASGDCMVLWIKNSGNQDTTLAEFNSFYGTSLTDNQVIQLDNAGMANSDARGFYITSKVGDVIDFVEYNKDGVDNTTVDKSINYVSTYSDGEFTSVMVEDAGTPTPGTIGAYAPTYASTVPAATATPVAMDNTVDTFSNSTESLTFAVTATSPDGVVKSVYVTIKDSSTDTYYSYQLTRDNGDVFTKTLEQIELLNKGSFTYYFTVSNGTNTTTTQETTIINTDGSGEDTFNVTDGQVVSGTQDFIAVGSELHWNGSNVTADSVASLSGDGYIVFNASQTDVFFKNAVSVGDSLLGTFDEGTYSDTVTYSYAIDPALYDEENNTITIEFHAGNKANALEHDIENNDDFTLQNIRMTLPNGKTIYPTSYQAIKGLGAVEHNGLNGQTLVNVTISDVEELIYMGDGTSKYEILYATFTLESTDFSALRYTADTTLLADGNCEVSNGVESVTVYVDNTKPEITTNVVEDADYHSITITASANDVVSGSVAVTATLDGKKIDLPYAVSSVDVTSGTHTLALTATDSGGNTATKTITFTTPVEHASFADVTPADGSTVSGVPTLSATVTDPSGDEMTVSFKIGEGYTLADDAIAKTNGIASTSGTTTQATDGFLFEQFDLTVSQAITDAGHVGVEWSGTSNNEKTFLYVHNVTTDSWDMVNTTQTAEGEAMTLSATVALEHHLENNTVKFMVQNGEGYTPTQYGVEAFDSENANDTPRSDYDFTFAVQSDTQYYNEDYEDNPDQSVDGVYQHQLNINNWLVANRSSMNIQYMFHNGDIVDDFDNIPEWELADDAYKILDEVNFPYGVLAGNHDVGHLDGDYDYYGTYFGDSRFEGNPWFWESYENNRGHYDLISVEGMDFVMVYMGWEIDDAEIDWVNEVLAQYPERIAILNFHEYLLASGGLGEEPQRIYDEVVAVNENVSLIFSGHYHNAATRVDTFTNEDGSERKVYSMLFDYQGLAEGGMGYIRLLHFSLDDETMTVRTYSPSLDDYNAADTVSGAESLEGNEEFTLTFADLGISSTPKTLTTTGFTAQVYSTEVIGTVTNVASGTTVTADWTGLTDGTYAWYAVATDDNGGVARTDVCTLTVGEGATVPTTQYPAIPLETVFGYENGTAGGLDVEMISRFDTGLADEDGGLVEIVAYNTTAQKAYVVAGSIGKLITVDMGDLTLAGLAGTGIDMKALVGTIDGFTYGDMSSVAINPDNTKLAVALQADGYNDDGKVAIFTINSDGSLAENPVFVDCGKQPDALTFTPDGSMILVANEGEPREGYGGEAVDPEGSVTVIDATTYEATKASFDGVAYDSNVLLKTGATTSEDFEPEYIAATNTTAYVALQENNAIAILDLASKEFTGVYGLGLQDFTQVAVDMQKDNNINLETQNNVYGIRMPDGISLATINGVDYLFTANEGDGREYEDGIGDDYCNENKSYMSYNGVEYKEKVTWFNPADYTMLDQTKDYLFGSRSFSIFKVTDTGLELAFDSGSDFEEITAELISANFNCSNDDISLEDRSGKKGVEPEYAMVGEVDGKLYAFIGLERLGGVMVYDVTNPAKAEYVNYINTRDYSDDIAGDVAPEGMAFISADNSPTGEALLLVANEVSGTMPVYELTSVTANNNTSSSGGNTGTIITPNRVLPQLSVLYLDIPLQKWYNRYNSLTGRVAYAADGFG